MRIPEKIILPQVEDPDFNRQILYLIERLYRDLHSDLSVIESRLAALEDA